LGQFVVIVNNTIVSWIRFFS